MTIEGYEGERILLSYDVLGASRGAAVEVCRIVFGRSRKATDGRVREEPVFIHRPGVVWIGQSVLIMPPRDADELADRLRRLGVRVARGSISITRSTLERFRRPG